MQTIRFIDTAGVPRPSKLSKGFKIPAPPSHCEHCGAHNGRDFYIAGGVCRCQRKSDTAPGAEVVW